MRKFQLGFCLVLFLLISGHPAFARGLVQGVECQGGTVSFPNISAFRKHGIGGGNSDRFAALSAQDVANVAGVVLSNFYIEDFAGLNLFFTEERESHRRSDLTFCFVNPDTGASFRENVHFLIGSPVPGFKGLFVSKYRPEHFDNQIVRSGKAICVGVVIALGSSGERLNLSVGETQIFNKHQQATPNLINLDRLECEAFTTCPSAPAIELKGLKLKLRIQALKDRLKNQLPN